MEATAYYKQVCGYNDSEQRRRATMNQRCPQWNYNISSLQPTQEVSPMNFSRYQDRILYIEKLTSEDCFPEKFIFLMATTSRVEACLACLHQCVCVCVHVRRRVCESATCMWVFMHDCTVMWHTARPAWWVWGSELHMNLINTSRGRHSSHNFH